jgi:MFS family permease
MLFGASAVLSFATWMERTAVGWLVLDQTGSVFLTALSWAVRTAPGMVVGPIAGALADRVSRPRLLAFSATLKGAMVAVIALVATLDNPSIVLILVLVTVSGSAMTVGIAAMQPLARDLAGPGNAMNAISLNSFGQRVVGTAGPLAAGFTIEAAEASVALALGAMAFVVSAVLFLLIRTEKQVLATRPGLRSDIAEGMRLMVRERTVGLLLLLMVVVENLGFSANAILPAVAEDVLDVGAGGFGALVAALGVGSILGTLGLAALGDYRHKGFLLTGTVAVFGALLVGLGLAEVFAAGMLVCVGLGAAMAAVDALEWILLQAAVADEFRGRAIGAWNFAIGFGWVGPVVMGGAASLLGVQPALIVFGIVLALVGVAASRFGSLRAL